MCHGDAMDCLSGGRFHAARYQRRPAEQHPARVSGHMPASVKWRTLFKNEMHDQGGAFAPPSLSCFPRNPSHSSVPASQTRHFPSPPDIEIAASPFPLPGFPLSPIYSMPLIPGTVKLLRSAFHPCFSSKSAAPGDSPLTAASQKPRAWESVPGQSRHRNIPVDLWMKIAPSLSIRFRRRLRNSSALCSRMQAALPG